MERLDFDLWNPLQVPDDPRSLEEPGLHHVGCSMPAVDYACQAY